MKSNITKDGFILIQAETVEEAYALKYVMEKHDKNSESGFPYIIDYGILNKNGDEK